MSNLEMLDAIGVPEFFVTRVGAIEDAGEGMVRVVRCVERHRVLVPVYSTITPACHILKVAPDLMAFARKILLEHVGGSH
jgi:hypothetical protein